MRKNTLKKRILLEAYHYQTTAELHNETNQQIYTVDIVPPHTLDIFSVRLIKKLTSRWIKKKSKWQQTKVYRTSYCDNGSGHKKF